MKSRSATLTQLDKPILAGLNYGIKPAYQQCANVPRAHAVFAVDQAKYNFAWLTHPELN